MGASLSTLGGWTLVLCIAGYYAFRYIEDGRAREAARAASHKQRLEDRQNLQSRKENKDKAKRQRGGSYTKDIEDSDKATKAKPRTSKPSPPTNQVVDYSSDDGADNREFARQLASIKQGTSFTGPKKGDEKRQKSVKQSQAQEREDKVSAPSSTAGADADDDQSPIASPEARPIDAGGVSDMLDQPSNNGPSVLRLTDTDKTKKKEKNAKAPEKTETKKQRQNRQKAEAAKLAREEAEQDRKVKLEAQRRLARVSEGRAAKDGSSSAASYNGPSAWTNNGQNGTSNGGNSNGGFMPVQPLDTFNTAQPTNASKAPAPSAGKADSWISSLPSEEDQLELLRDEEEAWNTVKAKKASKTKRKEATGDDVKANEAISKAEPVAPVTSQPVVTKAQSAGVNGRPSKTFTQQSSFAALSSNDEHEVEEEWDV